MASPLFVLNYQLLLIVSHIWNEVETRKVKMQIMKTNIGPEPVCHGHEIVNNGNQNRTDFPMTLTWWDGTGSPTVSVSSWGMTFVFVLQINLLFCNLLFT